MKRIALVLIKNAREQKLLFRYRIYFPSFKVIKTFRKFRKSIFLLATIIDISKTAVYKIKVVKEQKTLNVT